MLAKDVSYYTGKSFPFLFFSLLPVVLPEEVVRLKVRHVVNLDCHEPTSCQNGEVGAHSENILGCRNAGGVPILNEKRLNLPQREERALLELNKTRPIGRGALRED